MVGVAPAVIASSIAAVFVTVTHDVVQVLPRRPLHGLELSSCGVVINETKANTTPTVVPSTYYRQRLNLGSEKNTMRWRLLPLLARSRDSNYYNYQLIQLQSGRGLSIPVGKIIVGCGDNSIERTNEGISNRRRPCRPPPRSPSPQCVNRMRQRPVPQPQHPQGAGGGGGGGRGRGGGEGGGGGARSGCP